MLRLFAIALAALTCFFGFLIALRWLRPSDDLAALAATILAFVGVPALLLYFWRPASTGAKCPGGQGVYPECLYVVVVSPTEVRVTHPDRVAEAVRLGDLMEVQIVTNDSGPFSTDLWWLLLGRDANTGCSFPGGASGEKAVLELVQGLPGFDNEMFIRAMGSTSNARFSCWRAGA